MSKPIVIYLCYKYTENKIENAEDSCVLWKSLQDYVDSQGLNVIFFNPLWSHYQNTIVTVEPEEEHNFYLSWDLQFIDACVDAALYDPEHLSVSRGVTEEILFAKENNIPTFKLSEFHDLISWCVSRANQSV